MAEKVLDISDYFSTTNQREGVWYEPQINGVGCGFELKLIGIESDESSVGTEVYEKEYSRISKIDNTAEKNEALRHATAHRVANFVKGIRGVNGTKLQLNGKDIEYSADFVENLFYECLPIQRDVFDFVFDVSNFMTRKKKN